MNQRNLFDLEPEARARRTDPATSHEAAAQVNRTGRADAQREIVYGLVRDWPGMASIELADFGNLDRFQIARRLPELRDAGRIVSRGTVEISGRKHSRWYVA